MWFYIISIPIKVIVKLQIRHQLDTERPCLPEWSERNSIFEIVSRHNLANWILSSFPLKTQDVFMKNFLQIVLKNQSFSTLFFFIFVLGQIVNKNCFDHLLIKLFRHFDYFKTNYWKNADFFHKQHFNKQHQAETGKKLRKR